MILTEQEAKEFFVAAILAEASREGLALSENEKWMLRFSEADPQFVVDPSRLDELEQEISSHAYEAKVSGLLRRAYEHDTSLNSEARLSYREARNRLGQGDHYLLVMIDRGLGFPARAGSRRIVRYGFLVIVVPAAVLALVIAVSLGSIVFSGQTHSLHEAWPFALGCAFFACMTAYLVRLIFRERRA